MGLGWIVILVCSLLVYDALLFSSLRKEIWTNAEASARVAADSLRVKVATGVRFGKKLESYRGLADLLENVGRAADIPLAVLDTQGRTLLAHGDFPPAVPSWQAYGEHFFRHGDEQGATLLTPVLRRDGSITGYIGARIARAPLDAALYSLVREQMIGQCLIALAGILLLAALLRVAARHGRQGGYGNLFLRASCIGVFLLVMLGNGALAMHTVSSRYTEGLKADAARTGAVLTGDLNRLLLVGVSLNRAEQMDAYLASIAAVHGDAIALEIYDPGGQRFAGHLPPDAALLPGSQSFTLLEQSGSLALKGLGHALGWQLRVSLVRAPWLKRMIAADLDILTLVAIALIFMVEMFLLLARGMEARRSGSLGRAMRSGLFRPLMFVFILAMDMSVSFIPLRMAELTPDGVFSRDVLLGLPISAEMGMTGLSALVAGTWIKRRGARQPLMVGIVCMALGYLGSMLAATPWHFIAARAVVGLGYGLSLLTAQACTVRDGRLADMFAGVYAGSLCGSALGAMLAERMGYAPVFAVSACILGGLAATPLLFLDRDGKRAPVPDVTPDDTALDGAPEKARLSFQQAMRLMMDRRFLAFTALALLPSALLCVGFLNYFLPVYLKGADVAQSNIGRVYMLNCLIVIYSGPPLAALVMRSLRKASMVFWAGILSALSLLSFTVLPPLPASVIGAALLGLSTGLNIPAYSEYLLELDIARAIGVEQTMSLLDALQRVGQVLGPLCAGAALSVVSVDSAALWAGIGFAAISVLFLLLAGGTGQTCADSPREEET